jgi:hypothetical protein
MQGHFRHLHFKPFSMVFQGPQINVCLLFQLRLWIFGTLARVWFPRWECTWESLGSIFYILPNLWESVSFSNTLSWPHVVLHFTFSCKPNVRVITSHLFPCHTWSWVDIFITRDDFWTLMDVVIVVSTRINMVQRESMTTWHATIIDNNMTCNDDGCSKENIVIC